MNKRATRLLPARWLSDPRQWSRTAGTRLIQVTDDGHGMSPRDLRLSVERHATSKLVSISDLESIRTLGFRGEALPSVAAVASLEIVTRDADSVSAHVLRMNPGEEPTVSQTGAPRGTSVTVRDLFATIPARKKHLRRTATEFNHVSRVCYALALSHPSVSLRLIHNDREVLMTPGDGQLTSVLSALFGAAFARQLIELPPGNPPQLAGGYLGRPSQARSSRDHQYVFVNSRYIRSPLVRSAVEEAYRGLLTVHRHPVFFVYLEVDGSEVDVNVHPTKEQARFTDEPGLRRAVLRSVRKALREAEHIPVIRPAMNRSRMPTAEGALGSFREKQTEYESFPGWPDFRKKKTADRPPTLDGLRALAQVANSYIVAQGTDGLYIVDQHAAHERLVYEDFRSAMTAGEPDRQYLATPTPLELTPGELGLLTEHAEWLARWGFEWDEFGPGRILVRAVPAVFGVEARPAMLLELLDRLEEYRGDETTLLQEQQAAIILGSCKAAVKAHDHLDLAEQQALLDSLAQAEAPYTCPHGRPTVLQLSYDQLERFFKRRQ